MTGIQFFSQVTERSAKSYVAHLEARRPALLSDLAGWMSSTGASIEELDGTRESLIPLGGWLIAFVLDGAPGVPEHAVSSRARFLGWDVAEFRELARLQHATEPVAQYIAAVIRGEYPDARWTLQPDRSIRDSDFQEPVFFAAGRGLPLDQALNNRPSSIVEGWGSGRSQDGLLRLLTSLPRAEHATAPRAILRPSLDSPVSLADPIRAVPEAARASDAPHAVGQGMASESVVFAPADADFADLNASPPLDEHALADSLTSLGFRDRGQGVSASALLDPMTTLVVGEDVALLEPVVSAGRLRFLTFDTINATDEQFDRLKGDLDRLASGMGAYFGAAAP